MRNSEADVRTYREDGAAVVRCAVPKATAAAMLTEIDRHIRDGRDSRTMTRTGDAFSDRHLWPSREWMRRFCAETALPAIAGRFMESATARLYFDHIFVREPGTARTTPWHQDRPYWPFLGDQIASVWVALTDCNREASGLLFVRGSHRWGRVFRPASFGTDSGSNEFLEGNDAAEDLPDIDADPDAYELLGWDMEAGDAIVFGGEVIHGAKGNTSGTARRVAVSVRYVGEEAIWDPRPGTDPIVGSGDVSVRAGDPPDDDRVFPIVWRRTGTG